jgi:hypothetical protein
LVFEVWRTRDMGMAAGRKRPLARLEERKHSAQPIAWKSTPVPKDAIPVAKTFRSCAFLYAAQALAVSLRFQVLDAEDPTAPTALLLPDVGYYCWKCWGPSIRKLTNNSVRIFPTNEIIMQI